MAMIKNDDLVSPYQIAMIIIMTVISVGVFSIASDAANAAGPDGWLMVAFAGAVNILAVLVIVILNSRFPGKTFAEYSQVILGTILGRLLTMMFTIYLIFATAYVVRSFTEVIKMFVLFRTPTEIIMLSLILVCTYIVRSGVECVARINELIFPILFIPFLILMAFGLPSADFSNLRPFLQASPVRMLSAMPALAINYAGIELALFYIGFMENPKKAYKPAIAAVLFITFFLTIVTALCIAAFGQNMTAYFLWPLMSYIRLISMPGLFVEHLQGIMLSLWMLSVFTNIVSVYFVMSYSISKIAGTKEQKQYVLPLAMVIYYFALQPDSLVSHYELAKAVLPYFIILFLYVVPVILLLIAKLRKLEVK